MNIKYRQLKGFVLAAELGSFKAAANALSITQPSFSVLMKELEENLGLSLFERTARKCELTQAGEIFLNDIPDILTQLEQSYDRMTEVAEGRLGRIAIATVGSLSVGVIAQTLAKFQKKFPLVPVTLHELRNDMVFDMVAKGKVDLGIAALVQPIATLKFEPMFTDRLMLLVPRGHPLEGQPVRWKSLTRYPCVLMSTGPAEHALRANNVQIKPVFIVEHLATAVAMVRHGIGVTVLPSSVLSILNIEGLNCLQFEGKHAIRNLGVAFRNEAKLSHAATNFVQMLIEAHPAKGSGWQRKEMGVRSAHT